MSSILSPVVVALAVLAGALVPTPQASAAPSHKKSIWGPSRIDGVSQFPIYRDLGIGIYQTKLGWDRVAPTRPLDPRDPTDPAYRWDPDVDFAVQEAGRYGIDVSVMVLRTPRWANGGKEANVPPTRPGDYADFALAVVRRYPTVKFFMVWGEPIRSTNYLQHPSQNTNYFDRGQAGRRKLPTFSKAERADAQGYAQLLDTTYAALKRRDRNIMIVGGNSTTSGDVDPFNWARFLRLRNGKPARMDLYGHNPFGTRGPDLKKRQLVAGTADMSDLDVLVPWLDKYLKRNGRNRNLRLFLSEYTAPTDVPSYEFPYYVSRPVQATWLKQALAIARRWPRIYTLGWFTLRDPAVLADGSETRTGLIDARGVRKPAYYAFKRG